MYTTKPLLEFYRKYLKKYIPYTNECSFMDAEQVGGYGCLARTRHAPQPNSYSAGTQHPYMNTWLADTSHTDLAGRRQETSIPGGTEQWGRLAETDRTSIKGSGNRSDGSIECIRKVIQRDFFSLWG